MVLFDSIQKVIDEAQANANYTILDAVQELSLTIAFLAGLFIILFYTIRFVATKVKYIKKTGHMGLYKIGFRDESYIKGNVNIDKDILNDEVFDRLLRESELHDGIEQIHELYKKGMLFAYDIKITDSFKENLKGGVSAKIISAVPIDHQDVSWEDPKGEFSIVGSSREFFRQFPRNIFCSELSTKHFVKDYYGIQMPVYVIVPYTKAVPIKYLVSGEREQARHAFDEGKKLYTNIVNLPQHEAISKLAVQLVTMNKIHKDLEVTKEENRNLHKKIQDLWKMRQTDNIEKNQLRGMLVIKQLIGYANPYFFQKYPNVIGLAILGVVLGWIGAKLPEMQQLSQIPDYVWLGVMALAIVLIIKAVERKEPQPQPINQNPTQVQM